MADGVEGDLIEAGAWRGGAALLMRATLDTLGDTRTVWVADSFAGFPADERAEAGEPALSAYDFLAAPLEEVRDSVRAARARRRRRVRAGLLQRDAAAAGRPALGARPARRRHLRADPRRARLPLPRPRARRPAGDRRLRLVRGLPPGRRRVPRPSTGSPSRSSRSTPRASRWRREPGAGAGRSTRRIRSRRGPSRVPRPGTCRRRRRSRSPARRRTCAAAWRRPRPPWGCGRGCAGGWADDRLRLLDHRSRHVPARGGARHPPRRRAGLRGARQRRRRLDLPLLQPDHGHGRRPRRSRGARARPSGRRDRARRLLRHGCARRSRDPDVGVVGCVGAVGRPQHRVVGGLGHVGLLHPPLPGARRGRPARAVVAQRRAARPTPGPARSTPSTASCSPSRRGSCATSASTSRSARCTATTSTSACRCATPGARS